MTDEQVLDQQEPQTDVDPNAESHRGEDEPQYEPLPEGFDPAKYGLVLKDESEKTATELRAEAEAERKRLSDAQRALHEATGELSAYRRGAQPKPQQTQVTAIQAWDNYQQTGKPEWYDAFVRADQRERQELAERIESSGRAAQEAAEIAAVAPTLQEFGIQPDELKRQFNPETGGKWFDWDEAAMIAAARKAGGVKVFMDSLRKDGVSQIRKDVRKPTAAIPSGASRRSDDAPKMPDFDNMSDREYAQWEKANGFA